MAPALPLKVETAHQIQKCAQKQLEKYHKITIGLEECMVLAIVLRYYALHQLPKR